MSTIRSAVSFTDTEAHGNEYSGFAAEVAKHASLTLTDTVVNGNLEGAFVGAFTGASIEVENLSAVGNADYGIFIMSRGDGGVNNDGSSVTVNNATGVGSSTGAYVDVSHGGNATISNSDFHQNSAHGIFIDSEMESGTNSFVRIETTTVVENGGIANGGGIGIVRTHDLDVTIADSTIAYNVADEGGGIYAQLAGANPT